MLCFLGFIMFLHVFSKNSKSIAFSTVVLDVD